MFLWWRHQIEESTFSHLFKYSVYVFTVLNCSVRFFVFQLSILDCPRFAGPTSWSFYWSFGCWNRANRGDSQICENENVFEYSFASVSISRSELLYFSVGLTAGMNGKGYFLCEICGYFKSKGHKARHERSCRGE